MELTPAGRDRRGRRLRLLIAVMVPLALLSGILGYLSARHGWLESVMNDDRDGAWSWIGLSLIVLGLGIETWGLVRAWRTGANKVAWNSPLHDLSRQHRRDLRNQVRGRTPLDQDSNLLARDFAETMIRDHHRLAPIIGGLCVMTLGQTLQHSGLFWQLYLVAALLLMTTGLLIGRRDIQTARGFLAAHPEGATAS